MISRQRAKVVVPATILTTLLLWAPVLVPACGSSGNANGPGVGADGAADTSLPVSADGGVDTGLVAEGGEDAGEDVLAPPYIPRDAGEGTLAPLRTSCAFEAGAWPAETIGNEYPLGSDIPINHVIVIMQENRSFDHYLGRLVAQGYYKPGDFTVLPDGGADAGASDAGNDGGDAGEAGTAAPTEDAGSLGPPGSGFLHSDELDGPPAGWGVPDEDGGLVYPHADNEYCYGVDHSWTGQHTDFDNGKNDGFVRWNDPDGQRVMFYEDDTVIPFYYALANTFSVGDQYHCSVLGPTWPNRYFLMAATSFGIADNTFCSIDTTAHPVAQIFELLDRGGHTWSDYTDGPHMVQFFPYYGFQESTLASTHMKTLDCGLMADIENNTLPDVSFVMGDEISETSDEGPSDLPGIGGQVVEQIIRNLFASPAWKDTAVFITYDENGGIADHVPAAPACEPDSYAPYETNGSTPSPVPGAFNTTGFRVPFIVISPYAKAHYASHVLHDHTSITRFIEARFGLPALTGRDANATPPMEMFDFKNPPFMTPPNITAHTTVPQSILTQCKQSLAPVSCPDGSH